MKRPFCTSCQRDLENEEVFEGAAHLECGGTVKIVDVPERETEVSPWYFLGFVGIVLATLFAWLYLLEPNVALWFAALR